VARNGDTDLSRAEERVSSGFKGLARGFRRANRFIRENIEK
jgi:hypothetical protein